MTHKVGILNASSNEELYFAPFLYHSARYGTTLTHIQAVKSKSSLVSAGDHPMSRYSWKFLFTQQGGTSLTYTGVKTGAKLPLYLL